MSEMPDGWLPAYEGNDMAGFMMQQGFRLPSDMGGSVMSIVNAGNKAVIVSWRCLWIASPHPGPGFIVSYVTNF